MPEGTDQLRKANVTVAEKIGISLAQIPMPVTYQAKAAKLDALGYCHCYGQYLRLKKGASHCWDHCPCVCHAGSHNALRSPHEEAIDDISWPSRG